MDYSPEHLDYLSRSFLDRSNRLIQDDISDQNVYFPSKYSVRCLQILGVSHSWNELKPKRWDAKPQPYRTSDILAGCFGAKIPILFSIQGFASTIRVCLGTFDSPESRVKADGVDSARQFLCQSLEAHYPGIALQDDTKIEPELLFRELNQARFFGVLTGIPTLKTPEDEDGWTQIDRLIRTMSGHEWGILALAEPISASEVNEWLHTVTNEMRQVESTEENKARRAPVAELYYQNLELLAKAFQQGIATGLWHSSLYYFASDKVTFDCLGSSLCSCLGGDKSLPDPIRAIEWPNLAEVVPNFGQLLYQPDSPPGYFQYPYRYRTLLNSIQLSTLVHLPRIEVPGFYVRESAAFDVASHVPPGSENIYIGEILDRRRSTGHSYLVHVPELDKHCLLVGITGSGKTNTVFHLLKQLQRQDLHIPFLVIEPAKREYRQIVNLLDPGQTLRIFTLGEEHIAPFRLNPFEIHPGVSVQTHIDLLKSVFNASFAMWPPLPQVLERAIHEIYREKGWDPIYSTNDRAQVEKSGKPSWHYRAHPTLTDLYHKAAELVPKLGYDTEVTRNVRTALETRINSLRVGAKGLMLDTQLSIPIETLLDQPTILELEGVGDDDEKAFIIGLILIALYEYYRYREKSKTGLRHITVIEEAHRLLTNVPTSTDPEASNLRGKAVEIFVNMLSEVRTYGEGFLIAEQIPTKLASDVIKNTALKIMHRVVSNDDRQVMGGAMNLDEKQIRQVVALGTGEAVVHGGGKYSDDNPMLVRVPYAKGESKKPPTDQEIRKIWEQFQKQAGLTSVFLPYVTCGLHCQPLNPQCSDARRFSEYPAISQAFAAFVLTLVVTGNSRHVSQLPEMLRELYAELSKVIRTYITGSSENPVQMRCILTHGLYHYMEERGSQYGWPYQDIVQMTAQLLPAVLASASNVKLDSDTVNKLMAFCQKYQTKCQLKFQPFYGCDRVCGQAPICLYRHNIKPFLQDQSLDMRFKDAGIDWETLAQVGESAAEQVLWTQSDQGQHAEYEIAALCFAIQKVHSDFSMWSPQNREFLIAGLLKHYGL